MQFCKRFFFRNTIIVCKKNYICTVFLSIIMKKTHIILFLFIFVFLFATSYGKPVNRITAQQVANHFWTAIKGNNATLWTDISSQNGFHEFYLLENKEDAGFIIVSGDDCVQPILGYSTTSLIPSKIPEEMLTSTSYLWSIPKIPFRKILIYASFEIGLA